MFNHIRMSIEDISRHIEILYIQILYLQIYLRIDICITNSSFLSPPRTGRIAKRSNTQPSKWGTFYYPSEITHSVPKCCSPSLFPTPPLHWISLFIQGWLKTLRAFGLPPLCEVLKLSLYIIKKL